MNTDSSPSPFIALFALAVGLIGGGLFFGALGAIVGGFIALVTFMVTADEVEHAIEDA